MVLPNDDSNCSDEDSLFNACNDVNVAITPGHDLIDEGMETMPTK